VKRPLILIVEDDEETARLNMRMLKRRGYDVMTAYSAAEAREHVRKFRPDLFVLDIVLPDGNGISLCEEFRQVTDAPIVFLTGKKSTEDKVAGLGGGGDYYLTKPYSIDELIIVVERLLQRAQQTQQKLDEKLREVNTITRGPLTLNMAQRVAYLDGRDVELTPKEFAVLLLLVQNEGVELESRKIFEQVWNSPMKKDSGALRVQIARLKRKLDEENTDEFSILHMHGKGYTFITG